MCFLCVISAQFLTILLVESQVCHRCDFLDVISRFCFIWPFHVISTSLKNWGKLSDEIIQDNILIYVEKLANIITQVPCGYYTQFLVDPPICDIFTRNHMESTCTCSMRFLTLEDTYVISAGGAEVISTHKERYDLPVILKIITAIALDSADQVGGLVSHISAFILNLE